MRSLGQGSAADALQGPIEQMTQTRAAGFAFIFGILGAIWSASGYVGAFTRAANVVYETPEGRKIWKLKPLQLLITLIGVLFAAIILAMLVLSGPVVDQAALHGLLQKVRDIGLPLVSVTRVEPHGPK